MLKHSITGALAIFSVFAAGAQNNFTEDTDGLGIPMVFIEETTFIMGATEEQGDDKEDDENLHSVTISPFFIGATEITQGQWKKVMGTSLRDMFDKIKPDHEFGRYGEGDNLPMYYVTWNDASDFCRRLSEITGLNYRLPTESEWELAARGGSGKTTKYAGSDEIDAVGWHVDNSDMDRTNKGNPVAHPVATLPANAIGLHDMSGNVCEWVADYYSPYPKEETTDPLGKDFNGDRVYRGGAFRSSKNYCRISFRNSNAPDYASEAIGFRVVCEP